MSKVDSMLNQLLTCLYLRLLRPLLPTIPKLFEGNVCNDLLIAGRGDRRPLDGLLDIDALLPESNDLVLPVCQLLIES